ncbi:hypothetical protein [Afifella sp. IM 167]|nr:hypothetical protein [Afifella sp. IM 167]
MSRAVFLRVLWTLEDLRDLVALAGLLGLLFAVTLGLFGGGV